MSDLQALNNWAESLEHVRQDRGAVLKSVQQFIQCNTPLLNMTDNEKNQWLGERNVCPLWLLTDPQFDIAYVAQALEHVPRYNHLWGEQSLRLLHAADFLPPEAVEFLAPQIKTHEAFKYVRTWIFPEYKGQTSEYMCEGVVVGLVSHPHSFEALKVWSAHFPMQHSSVKRALFHILSHNFQNIFNSYTTDKENSPVLEALQLYSHMGPPHPELFRNISYIWGMANEPSERLKQCMDIVGQLSQICGIDEIVSQVDSVKTYTYLRHTTQERLQQKMATDPNETYSLMLELCEKLYAFDELMYPILTQHNFSVAKSSEHRIMGDTPMTEYSMWVWDAFLKHATPQQWGVYMQELHDGHRLVVGTHDELKEEPLYMQKFLQQHVGVPLNTHTRKM